MKKLTTKEFIEKAIIIHGDKYNYSKTSYVNSSTKCCIICPSHGEFLQRPNDHLKPSGCSKCGTINMANQYRDSKEDFIKKANIVHGNKYSYSKVEYKNNSTKISIICKTHGDFKQNPSNHLKGKGCKICGNITKNNKNTYNTKDFITKANKKHNNLYNYFNVNYINSKEKIEITCTLHGNFSQTPAHHLSGRGCPKCGNESHWKRSGYIKKAKNKICTFYIIKCFSEVESFYKIGITKHTLKIRYKEVIQMPYKYEIISEIKGEAGKIWDLELQEKRKLKQYNYQPKIKFKGSKTECFTTYNLNANEK